MKIRDLIKISQSNLLRSKLRTFLTVGAIFVGAFTISLTNGVGNGIKEYVDSQLGNVDVPNTLIVQARQESQNPFGNDVAEYDPNKTTGQFNVTLLGENDLKDILAIKGVEKVAPELGARIEYIGTSGNKKYNAVGSQYVEGLDLVIEEGQNLNPETASVSIPGKYVSLLGFSSSKDAVNKKVMIGYKDSTGTIREIEATISGVQQESIIGNSGIYISPKVSQEIHNNQILPGSAAVYQNFYVKYNFSFNEEQVESLKQILNANGYTASTFKEQIGVINTVIDSLLMVLNVFSAIALLAATFGIVNTLLMAVKERTSEIGLMKALGANRGAIFSIFALEAASIGFWGGLLGILVSTGAGLIINNFASKNFLKDLVGFNLLAFPLSDSLFILAGIILLAFIAGTLPSLKASKLNAIEALRYE